MTLRRLMNDFDDFFLRPGDPRALALFRICFYSLSIISIPLCWTTEEFPQELYLSSVLGGWLPIPRLQDPAMIPLSILGFFLAASAAGFLSNFSRAGVVVLSLWIFGNQQQFGFHPETSLLIMLGSLILLFARVNDAFSMDSWIRERKGRNPIPPSLDLGLYSWPIQLFRVVWVIMVFGAGYLKLRHAGWSWASRDALRWFLIQHQYFNYPHSGPLSEWGQFFLDRPWLTTFGSYSSLLLELSMPLALVSRYARAVLIPAFIVMLILVKVLFGHPFVFWYMPGYLMWLPWDYLAGKIKQPTLAF
ncbi:MAG: HTTM domain-containing protein [Bdellovibrionota bacterium]